MQAFLFFTIFFTLHGLINLYIFIRGWHAIPSIKIFKFIYSVFFILFFTSSVVEMFLYRFPYSSHVQLIHWAGSFWYGFMTYFFLSLVLIDIIRVSLFLLRIRTPLISENYAMVKLLLFFIVTASVSFIMYKGYNHARDLRVTVLKLEINKQGGRLKSLNIAMISDLHINRLINRERILMIAEEIKSINPDIILIPGDIVDSYIGPFKDGGICSIFAGMKSKYGIYASTGNHEFYGDIEETIPVLESCGIKFLRDKVVLIDNSIYIAGREDQTGEKYYSGYPRLRLNDLLKNNKTDLPVILMDHSPGNLEDAFNNGVDLQISGHTHNGQLFPYTLIVKLIYELPWGYYKRGITNYYVSCGAGSWGPPVRVGSFSEILNIRLEFKSNKKN